MGERLVMAVIKDGKKMANIYFHWSGYTVDAIGECARILTAWSETDPDSDSTKDSKPVPDQVRLYRIVEAQGGGFARNENLEGELAFMKSIDENFEVETDRVNRNEGLISFTEKGMGYSDMWAEELASINLDQGTFNIEGTFFGMYEEDWDDRNEFEEMKESAITFDIFQDFDLEEAEDLKSLLWDVEMIMCDGEYWRPV